MEEMEKEAKKFTTLSVDTEVRQRLEKVNINIGKRMTWNDIINKLIDNYWVDTNQEEK